jgi:hypothetical protein
MTTRTTPTHPSAAPAAVPPVTGVGTVWCGPRRLADVYYQFDGIPDAFLRTGAPVLRAPAGQLTLLVGDWWALLSVQEHGEDLDLGDGQRVPFLIYGGVWPQLWIRGLRDLAITARAAPSPRDRPRLPSGRHRPAARVATIP